MNGPGLSGKQSAASTPYLRIAMQNKKKWAPSMYEMEGAHSVRLHHITDHSALRALPNKPPASKHNLSAAGYPTPDKRPGTSPERPRISPGPVRRWRQTEFYRLRDTPRKRLSVIVR